MNQEPASVVLFGRSEILRSLITSEASLTLIVGDSGIGKTELLAKAQATAISTLSPAPVEVFSRDGAIVEALSDSLALALAQVVADSSQEVQLKRAQEFVLELVRRSGPFMFQVARSAVIQQLRRHLGESAVKLGAELANTLMNGEDGSIGSRLGDLRNAGVLMELSSLATEILDLSRHSTLSIALDRLEILPETDIRLLADLTRMLPDEVVLKAALLDTTQRGTGALQLLRTLGGPEVAVVPVPPLEEAAVREMLESEGLDQAAAPDVCRLTGGYPLHVGDLVRHLATGGKISGATTNTSFGQLIQPRWDALTSESRQVARQLCVAERPLPLKLLLLALGMHESAWWDIAETLRTERIFTQTVDDMPWFHEQRRRWLVDQLPEEELRATASKILPTVCEAARGDLGWHYCTTLSKLMAIAAEAIVEEDLKNAAALGNTELAIVGAALELGASETRPIDPALLLTHARRTFRSEGDLLSALASLERSGQIVVHRISEFHATGVHAVLTPLEVVAIGGLCQDRLGRLPVLDLAMVLWETSLGKDAPPMHLAVCGVGWADPGREIDRVHATKMRATRTIGPFHGCLVIGDLQGVPAYAVASTEPDQVAGLEAAWSGAAGEVGGCTFKVLSVMSVPGSRLRGQRWSVVADDLLGRHLPAPGEAASSVSLKDKLEMTVATRQAIRGRCGPTERLVAGRNDDMHIYYQQVGDETTIVQALGQAPGVTEVKSLDPWWIGDSFVALRFAQQLSLPLDCRVGTIATGPQRLDKHPLRTSASNIERGLQSFNQHHLKVRVDVREGELEDWLLPLMDLRYQDSRAVFETVKSADFDVPSKYEVFIVAAEVGRSPMPSVSASLAMRPASESKVNYKLFRHPSEGFGPSELNRVFPDSLGLPMFSSGLGPVLARMSGFKDEDLAPFVGV